MPAVPATPRRRRDGQAPAEQAVAAQRAPQPQAHRGRVVVPVAAALATVGAAGTAAAGAAAPPVAAAITGAAVAKAAEAILSTVAEQAAAQLERLPAELAAELERELPDAPPEQIQALVRGEVERERVFQGKARERMARDLPKALAIEDPAERRAAVQAIMQREQRYEQQRREAVAERAAGQATFDRQRAALEPQGVTGMFWRLNPRLEHCAVCTALGGRVWPWTVLALYPPPRHPNCGCKLWSPEDAYRMGWATPADVVTADQAVSMIHLLEAAVLGEHSDDLTLREAVSGRAS